MQLNSKKFQAIRFAELFAANYYRKNSNPNDAADEDDDIQIEQVAVVKDLGIYFSQDLSFEHHTRMITNKGKQMVGWIFRTFHTRCPSVMLTLLKQLIYPTVEYNSILWSPQSQPLINLLESVQKNFLRKIDSPTFRPVSDYWDHV